MKTLAIVSLLLFVPFLFATNPVITKAHKASYQIFQNTITNSNSCSATAIGPQALITATHCEEPTDILKVNGFSSAFRIMQRIRDGNDHTIYLVSGDFFPDYVDVDLNDPVEIAEDVFTFGNASDWTDIYQRGYVATIQGNYAGGPPTIMFAFQSYNGESGSGIFNNAGQLIAVLSYDSSLTNEGGRIAFGGAIPLAFKQEDLEKARIFLIIKP